MSDLDRLKSLIDRLRTLEERSPEQGWSSQHGAEFGAERVRREVSEIAGQLQAGQSDQHRGDRLAC